MEFKKGRYDGKRNFILSLIILIFVLTLCNISVLNAQNVPKKLTPVEVYSIEWGNDNGQVGLLKVPGRNYFHKAL